MSGLLSFTCRSVYTTVRPTLTGVNATQGHRKVTIIIKDGTHDELIAKDRHYAKMRKIQTGGFLPKTKS